MDEQIWIYGEDFVSAAIGPFSDYHTANEHMAWCRAANMNIAGTVYEIRGGRPVGASIYYTPEENRVNLFQSVAEIFASARRPMEDKEQLLEAEMLFKRCGEPAADGVPGAICLLPSGHDGPHLDWRDDALYKSPNLGLAYPLTPKQREIAEAAQSLLPSMALILAKDDELRARGEVGYTCANGHVCCGVRVKGGWWISRCDGGHTCSVCNQPLNVPVRVDTVVPATSDDTPWVDE